jgi:sialate O-acetylesterase
MDAWYLDNDQGLKGNWAALDVDESNWKAVDGPGDFKSLGVPDNAALAWFRRTVTLPDPLPAGQPTLNLGAAGRGTTYLNGTLLGGRGGIQAGLIKPGKNVVATRVLRLQTQGGGPGRGGATEPRLALGETAFPLTGEWKGRISVEMLTPEQMPIQTMTWATMPTVHYEGMLTPVVPFSITGALWYQGEQNTEYAYHYRRLLPVMVADWRRLFGQGDFPFYSVSLPAFKQRSTTPVDDTWAEERESQAVAAATIPNSCLAITIDTGDASNLHPKEKAPVGDRLARCALAKYYGVKTVYSGPTLSTVERLPGAIRLHFANMDGGLVVKGDKPGEFSIAGEDRKWVWADARIEGDTVVVSSPAVPNPKEVRYAWQGNPVATLFNGAGLPAGPFRTDTWPLVTEGRRPY